MGRCRLLGTSGSYDGARHLLDFVFFPRIDELTALQSANVADHRASGHAACQPVQIVSSYSLVSAVGGILRADNGTTRLTLSNLSITDSPQWLSITKAGDAPLEIVERPDGTKAAREASSWQSNSPHSPTSPPGWQPRPWRSPPLPPRPLAP